MLPEQTDQTIRREVQEHFLTRAAEAFASVAVRDEITNLVIARLNLTNVVEDFGYAAVFYVVVDALQENTYARCA